MKIQQSEVTVRNARQLIAAFKESVSSGDLTLDFSGVEKIDSSALALVLAGKRALENPACARQGSETAQKLNVINRPAQFDSLVAAYGVQSLF